MATVTLTAPPGPFSCALCSLPQWKDKGGDPCKTCPAFKDTHYHPTDIGIEAADIIVLGDVPAPPRPLSLIGGKSVAPPMLQHQTFEDAGGKVVRLAVEKVLSRREFSHLGPFYTYAVKCTADNPKRDVVYHCGHFLKQTVARIADRRQTAGKTTPLVVLACGKAALAALGISVQSEEEALNRVFDNVLFGGTAVQVVATRSLKAIGSQSGKFNMLLADCERAALLATQSLVRTATRSDIEKDYVYPTSIREIEDLVSSIIAYTEGNVEAKNWVISFDTETNTLHPNWVGTKLLSVSMAWGRGKAASIALWHPQNTMYDPAVAYEEVKRLLQSNKPLIWHNGKYDYKVFWRLGWPQGDVGNTYWDTMLAEHVLEEDKKQGYSLKVLTKQRLPELAGYEDVLQSMLEKDNDALKPEEVADENEAEAEAVASNNPLGLPTVLLEAFNRVVELKLISSPGFRAATLEKALPRWLEKDPQVAKDLKLLISAKKNGEFTQTKKKAKDDGKSELGGFESIPLSELLFYGAVDADATRRIAVIQSKRMSDEDAAIQKARVDVAQYQKVTRDPRERQYPVQKLCPHVRPLHRLVQEEYLPRQRELAKIEYNGMAVDLKYLDASMPSLTQTIDHTATSIFRIAGGEPFKLGSTQRLSQLLFSEGYVHPNPEAAAALAEKYPEEVFYDGKRIRYKPTAYTAKGAIQTSDNVMKALTRKYECPLANLLLTYKKAYKAKNTFFANIRALAMYFNDGLLRAGYGLINTSTGRLSSRVKIGDARFNAQNVPKGLIGALNDHTGSAILDAHGRKVFEGVNCKKLFIPDAADMVFANCDAKGAEVTIYAAYSKDPALIAALRAGLDPHCFFGSECLNPMLVGAGLVGEARRLALAKAGIDDHHAWSYDDFLKGKDCSYGKQKADGTRDECCLTGEHAYCKRLKALRDNIKRLVFGMLYGAGITKIAEIAGISLEFAKKIQELLFTKFPTIRTFMERTKWELRTFNMVEAFNGRRRRFLLGRGAPSDLRAQAERQAINFKVQGTSSDIVLSVLCWIAPVVERDMGGRLLLTVHDSIGLQVPNRYAHQLKDLIYQYGTQRVSEACPWLPSPYRWDVEGGPSYGELSDIASYISGLAPMANEADTNTAVALASQEDMAGYTEEEQFDDLRNFTAFQAPERRKALEA